MYTHACRTVVVAAGVVLFSVVFCVAPVEAVLYSEAGASAYTIRMKPAPTAPVQLLPNGDFGLDPQDDVDALSLGNDPYAGATSPIGPRLDVFAVSPGSTGTTPGGALTARAALPLPVERDIYRESSYFNEVLIPGLIPDAAVDAFEASNLVDTGNESTNQWIYFSLAPGSPTLAANGWQSNDVLMVQYKNSGTLALFADAAQFGSPLELDALSLKDQTRDGNPYDPANDMLIYSSALAADHHIYHYGHGEPGGHKPHTYPEFGIEHSGPGIGSDDLTALEHIFYRRLVRRFPLKGVEEQNGASAVCYFDGHATHLSPPGNQADLHAYYACASRNHSPDPNGDHSVEYGAKGDPGVTPVGFSRILKALADAGKSVADVKFRWTPGTLGDDLRGNNTRWGDPRDGDWWYDENTQVELRRYAGSSGAVYVDDTLIAQYPDFGSIWMRIDYAQNAIRGWTDAQHPVPVQSLQSPYDVIAEAFSSDHGGRPARLFFSSIEAPVQVDFNAGQPLHQGAYFDITAGELQVLEGTDSESAGLWSEQEQVVQLQVDSDAVVLNDGDPAVADTDMSLLLPLSNHGAVDASAVRVTLFVAAESASLATVVSATAYYGAVPANGQSTLPATTRTANGITVRLAQGALAGADVVFRAIITYDDGSFAESPFTLSLPASGALAGEWFVGGSDVQDDSTWNGTVILNTFGQAIAGTITSSAGGTYSITNGNFSMSATGTVTGSFTDSRTPTPVTTNFTMQMNSGEGVMAGEGNAAGGGEDGAFVFVKKSSQFATDPDLAGTWFLGGEDLQDDHTWDGQLTIDSTGTVTGGTYNSSEGGSNAITGGTFSFGANGAVTGSFTDFDGAVSVTTGLILQMDWQKGVMAGPGKATTGTEEGMFILVKRAAPQFVTADLAGTWFVGGSDLQGEHTWDAVITIDNTGTVVAPFGTYNSSEGTTTPITSGSFSIAADGTVTGSFTDTDPQGDVTTSFTLQMNDEKDLMGGEGNVTVPANDNEDGLFTFTKQTGAGTPVSPLPAVTGLNCSLINGQITLNWTAPNDPDYAGVVILRRDDGPVTAEPAPGTQYSAGQSVGGAHVVYVGSGVPSGTFADADIPGGGVYHYGVFAHDATWGYAAGQTTQCPVHSVQFVAWNHGTITGDAVQLVAPGGATAAVIPSPDPGYQFVDWTGDYFGADSPLVLDPVTGDMVVFANFATTKVDLTIAVTGNGALPLPGVRPVVPGTPYVVAAAPQPGNVFVEWTLAPPTDGTITNPTLGTTEVIIAAPATLTAVFAEHLVADFRASPRTVATGQSVQFTSQSVGTIAQYSWDFGDTGTHTGPEPQVQHIYSTPGIYDVSLTVSDARRRASDTITKQGYIQVTGRSIQGRVTAAADGTGINGCLVEVWKGNGVVASATTTGGPGVEGTYAIPGLPLVGGLIVAVWPPPDQPYHHQFHDGAATWDAATRVTTVASDLTLNFALQSTPQNGIEGTVYNTLGTPANPTETAAGALVRAFSASLAVSAHTLTDAGGHYTFHGLLPAPDYKVSVWPEVGTEEFYYAIPEGQTPGQYAPTYSVLSWEQATALTPTDPPLTGIDIVLDPDAVQTGTIEGTVFETDGVTPVPGVLVHAWSSYYGVGGSTVTNANGTYRIDGLTVVPAPSAAQKGYIVEVPPGRFPGSVYTAPRRGAGGTRVPTGSTGIDLSLRTVASVAGTVTDTTTANVAGVTVIAWSPTTGSIDAAITDANGNYAINGLLPAADYVITAFPEHYPVQYYNQAATLAGAAPVDLFTQDRGDIDFTLDRGPTIQGKVTIENTTTPAPGVTVSILAPDTNLGGTALTDANGHYELRGLPNGTNYVVSVLGQHQYLPAFYNSAAGNSTVYRWVDAEPVPPQPYATSTPRNLVLTAGVSISGAVTHGGAAIAGISVQAWSATARAWGVAQTAGTITNGSNYTITGLVPNTTYEVQVAPAEHLAQTQSNVAVTQQNATGVDFILEKPSREIRGTVSGLGPGDIATVYAWSAFQNSGGTAPVVGTGGRAAVAYSIPGLVAAPDYTVEVRAPRYRYQAYNNKTTRAAADLVDLETGDKNNINFALTPAAVTISGVITFPQGAQPGENVRVEVFSLATGEGRGVWVTLQQGSTLPYAVTGLAEADDYVVSAWPDTYRVQFFEQASDMANATLVDTTDQVADTAVDFDLSAGRSIAGTIDDGTGAPAPNTTVEAWSRSTGSRGSARTAADGTFTIIGLEQAADFLVAAIVPGQAPFVYHKDGTVRDPARGGQVSTVAGDLVQIDISLAEGMSISGTVRDTAGRALGGLWVNAWSVSRQAGNGVFTLADGSYQIPGLPDANDYTVAVRPGTASPYKGQQRSPVAAGNTGVDFVLTVGHALTGTVTDGATGAAVAGVDVQLWSEAANVVVWTQTDETGLYELSGLPTAADYLLTAAATSSAISYIGYAETGLSITADVVRDIALTPAATMHGRVLSSDGVTPVPAVLVTASSAGTGFSGRAYTDADGDFEIPNMPPASDYTVTARPVQHAAQQQLDQSPDDQVIFVLESGGAISGTVRDASGLGLPNVRIVVESLSMNVRAVGLTGANGLYEVNGLRALDRDGNPVADYVVTAFVRGYPPMSKGGRSVGDVVDLTAVRGTENEFSGSIADATGAAPGAGVVVVVEVFDETLGFVKRVNSAADGSFLVDGLRPDRYYQLKFEAPGGSVGAPEAQWAATEQGGEDFHAGVGNVAQAGSFLTQPSFLFRFASAWTGQRGEESDSRDHEPGAVVNLHSTTHTVNQPSSVAQIAVAWSAPAGAPDLAGYYTAFSVDPAHAFDTSNTAGMDLVEVASAISPDYAGQGEITRYFHVAAVDTDGAIGATSHLGAFRIDTNPPTDAKVEMPAATAELAVVLTLGATGATEMYISNTNYGIGGAWEPFVASKLWQLTDGDGQKTVYVQFRDSAGNIAQAFANTVVEPGVELTFQPGWNLLSLPFDTPETRGPTQVLVDATGAGLVAGSVQFWDAEQGAYGQIQRGFVGKFGFWAYSPHTDARTTTPIRGPLQDGDVYLWPGWNLIGPYRDTPVANIIRRRDGHGAAWYWDAQNQVYRAVPEGGTLERGRGYWMFNDGQGTWIQTGN